MGEIQAPIVMIPTIGTKANRRSVRHQNTAEVKIVVLRKYDVEIIGIFEMITDWLTARVS